MKLTPAIPGSEGWEKRMRIQFRMLVMMSLAVYAVVQNDAPARAHAADNGTGAPDPLRSAYVLGADDQIQVKVLNVDEIDTRPIRIDMSGYMRLPYVGRVRASGLTAEQLEAELAARFREYIKEPDVSVSIAEFRSQPVSVIGAVKNPGIHQLQGRKTLIEMLSLAGGMDAEAGSSIRITRQRQWGAIPLKTAKDDPSGRFSVAEVSVKSIVEAKSPEENIEIRPNDVISVPRAEMVYVVGEVQRAGGFVLNDHETITVLQALALAGGAGRPSSPQHSRILRPVQGDASRVEIPVDVRGMLQGKVADVAMQPDDILFIPASVPKRAALRAIEAAVQIGTGVAIWRR